MSVSHNINQVQAQFNAMIQRLDDDMRAALKKTAQHLYDQTEQGADKHTVTGALRNAVYLKTERGGYEIGIDHQSAPHVEFVHFKTRPHLIKPKNKKALRWAQGGKFFFAKAVQHPGYKGDPFFHDAVDSGLRYLDQQINQLKLKG
jgi:hypothetical protein